MEERVKSIKNIYNDCAKNFNQYLIDHDMAAYNKRSEGLVEKYKGHDDVVDLLFYFAPRVNELHRKWRENTCQ